MLGFTVNEIPFEILYLEKVGQSHGPQLLPLASFDGKYKNSCRFEHFCDIVIALNINDIINWNIWPWKSRSISQTANFSMAPFDGKYQNPWKSYRALLLQLSSLLTRIFAFEKVGQCDGLQLSQWLHSVANMTRQDSLDTDIFWNASWLNFQIILTIEFSYDWWPWVLECAKVKGKYANWKPI